jgi:hypothetical protein
MAVEITINSLTGASDFDVYICDTGFTSCVYYSTLDGSTIYPYTFFTPPPLDNQTDVCVKIVDNNNCIITGCTS